MSRAVRKLREIPPGEQSDRFPEVGPRACSPTLPSGHWPPPSSSDFERGETPAPDRKEVYRAEGPGYKATGLETNTGFTVLKGSLARAKTAPSMERAVPGYYRQRQALISEGVLEKTAEGYRFTADWFAGSPSAAAAVCRGSSANGLVEWKDESGTTLKANRKKATA